MRKRSSFCYYTFHLTINLFMNRLPDLDSFRATVLKVNLPLDCWVARCSLKYRIVQYLATKRPVKDLPSRDRCRTHFVPHFGDSYEFLAIPRTCDRMMAFFWRDWREEELTSSALMMLLLTSTILWFLCSLHHSAQFLVGPGSAVLLRALSTVSCHHVLGRSVLLLPVATQSQAELIWSEASIFLCVSADLLGSGECVSPPDFTCSVQCRL